MKTKIDRIKEFESIIEENRFAMLQLIITYNMKCHCNYEILTYKEKEKLIDFIYNIYMKDETKTDLAVFSDIIMNNYKKVLNEEITRQNIYNFLEV